ncbi:MAG: ArnT family glycosyltransferase [Nanoarchaeota archaeon]
MAEEDTIKNRKDKLKNKISNWLKDPYNKLFLALIILALIIRILIFLKTSNQPIWWDTADYLSAAKNWAGINPNFLDTWYYRRGFFWPFFASLFYLTGLGEIGLRFSVVLISTGVVAFTYLLISKMFNKRLALLTSFCVAFSWVVLFFSGRPMTELPSTFFLLGGLYFFWNGFVLNESKVNYYLFGIFAALAALTRMQYLMFAIPLFLFMIIKDKHKVFTNKHLWTAVLIVAIIFIPQFIMHANHFGNPFLDLANYYLGVKGISKTGEVGGLALKFSDLFVYFFNLPYILDGVQKGYSSLFVISPMYILFLIGFVLLFSDLFLGFDKIFKNPDIQKRFFVLSWIVITFLLLGYIAPHLEQRYAMQTLPFLFLIAVYPINSLFDILKNKTTLQNKTISFGIIILLVALMMPNMIWANNLIEIKKTSYLEVKLAGEWIKVHSNPEDIIISASRPQTEYYSERTTYPFNLAIRRDVTRKNRTEFEEFVKTQHPRYMTVSIFEQHPDWINDYIEKSNNTWMPVMGYQQNNQPVLIIYENNYYKTSLN